MLDKESVIYMFIAITLLVFITAQIRSCELERQRIETVGYCYSSLMNNEKCKELIEALEE